MDIELHLHCTKLARQHGPLVPSAPTTSPPSLQTRRQPGTSSQPTGCPHTPALHHRQHVETAGDTAKAGSPLMSHHHHPTGLRTTIAATATAMDLVQTADAYISIRSRSYANSRWACKCGKGRSKDTQYCGQRTARAKNSKPLPDAECVQILLNRSSTCRVGVKDHCRIQTT